MDIDDEELCNARELMGSLWTRLAVDLARRFDDITVANGPQQAG